MSKKTINIIYWVSTGLILAMMLFSAASSFMDNPDGAKMLAAIGYRPYVLHLLAVAKVLGVIAILTPGFHGLKNGLMQVSCLILSARPILFMFRVLLLKTGYLCLY